MIDFDSNSLRLQPHERRSPIAWMAAHPVSANLLMVVFLLGGLFMGARIKKEVFPDFELDRVEIRVVYPGAGPEEVERGIIYATEEVLQDIEGIDEIHATANEGSGQVVVEIIAGEDVDQIAREIENEVNRIQSFPDDAEDPVVTISQRKRFVVSLALYGDLPGPVLQEAAETIRERLSVDDAIGLVSLEGARDSEISIEVDQNTLRSYSLTIGTVARAIAAAVVELPGGAIKTDDGDILVRVNERRDLGREFADIPVLTAADGTRLLVGDLATITDGLEDTDRFALYNGQPAVLISVYRSGDQSPISVSEAVAGHVADLKESLPQGLSVDTRRDRSEIYRQRLELMLRNGMIGLMLVFILLALFLEFRLAFWVALGIPISFIGSFLILHPLGVSINMVTMFAFIVTLGIVVDDAIIVGENIYAYRQNHMSWFEAAVRGAREITLPVTFSVMSNMITFTPMLFIPGFMGKIFKFIPLVVFAVFSISLIESLFILPAHLGHRKDRTGDKGMVGFLVNSQQRFGRAFTDMVRRVYRPFLTYCLKWRYVSAAVGVMILLITFGYIKSGRMGFVLFPKIESDYAQVSLNLPFGASVQSTLDVSDYLVDTAQMVAKKHGGDKLVEGIFSDVNGHNARIRVYLTKPDIRPISTAEFTAAWRAAATELMGIENIKFESDAGGPGRGAAITVELSHRDTHVLEQAGGRLAAELVSYPNVKDVDDGFSQGKRQIDFALKPTANRLGLTTAQVARSIRDAFYGAEALRVQRGRDEVKVMVRLPKAERESSYFLDEMVIPTPDQGEVLLRDVVEMKPGRAETVIYRRNGRRVVTVEADVEPRGKAGAVLADLRQDFFPQLSQLYPGLSTRLEGRRAEQRESMAALMKGLLLALLVIYAMLAVPFNSYIQPLIVMCAIPFGLVGAVLGHLLMGYSFSVISMFGIVALSGVVVNDSLVMIDFANRRRKKGVTPLSAIVDAARQRFRPILLTTLTTFGGLAPMIFETSRQARFLIPMAISLGYGILFATLITLVLVPVFYMIVEDLLALFGFQKSATTSP